MSVECLCMGVSVSQRSVAEGVGVDESWKCVCVG